MVCVDIIFKVAHFQLFYTPVYYKLLGVIGLHFFSVIICSHMNVQYYCYDPGTKSWACFLKL